MAKRWPSVKVKHLGCMKATKMRTSNSHKDLIFSENSNSSGFLDHGGILSQLPHMVGSWKKDHDYTTTSLTPSAVPIHSGH